MEEVQRVSSALEEARAQLMGLAMSPDGAATLLGAQRDEGL